MENKFRQLVAEHKNRVYAMAKHILHGAHDAEDVTQDAFVKLWHHIESIESERAGQWLSRVTRNLCIDRLRANRCEELVDEDTLASLDSRIQPALALEQSRLSKTLRKSIASLKEPYRSLIVMCEIQQRKQHEVADILGISPNQVKVYAFRARQQLKAKIET